MVQTIGVIGGGQLGRMFTLDAKRMGFDVIALDPQPHSPCGQVADEQIVASYDDFAAIDELGQRTDVVTYEFENIAVASVQRLEQHGYRVTPASTVLAVTQHRVLEKQFLEEHGIAVAPFAPVRNDAELRSACEQIGFPAVLKTVRGGYDGKGQWRLDNTQQMQTILHEANGADLIYERFISFDREISVICTRGADGACVTYPASENIHDAGILATSIVPARVPEPVDGRAREIAIEVAAGLGIVGTFCVEFFVCADGKLLVNEIAPRPHNSGHYTIDATQCSQYEQHVRAICGLPLSPPFLLRNAVMMNILGMGTGDHLDGVAQLLADPSIVLHMYGKRHAPVRRKMGHFTMLVDGPVGEAQIERARRALDLLDWVSATSKAAC